MFLDQLARLGVINKVSTLAGPTSDDENEEESKPEKVCMLGKSFLVLHRLSISVIGVKLASEHLSSHPSMHHGMGCQLRGFSQVI